MLRTFDVVLIVVMTAAATVTYSIKHRAELKQEDVHHLEAEIKLEHDTIDLLRADWALLSQPSRLERLASVYAGELQLVPTESTQLVHPVEMPMRKADVPAVDVAASKAAGDKATSDKAAGDKAGANKNAKTVATAKPAAVANDNGADDSDTDEISTGSVE